MQLLHPIVHCCQHEVQLSSRFRRRAIAMTSAQWIRKNTGRPRTLPCRTPQVSDDLVDCTPSMLTDWLRFRKKGLNFGLTPNDCCRRPISISQSTASKAAARSINCTYSTSLITFSTAVSVECLPLGIGRRHLLTIHKSFHIILDKCEITHWSVVLNVR